MHCVPAHPTDAEILTALRQLLRETPPGLSDDLANAPIYFPNRGAFERWRTRWLPMLTGRAWGPTSVQEYARLRPELGRARVTGPLDMFHAY